MWLSLLIACADPVLPADRAAFQEALAFPLERSAEPSLILGSGTVEREYTLSSASFQAFDDGFQVAAALLRPDRPTGAGVLVTHGHFGQGKSSPEAQQIARRLARRGATVLLVDTPGVEEWDQPGRWIHFARGAHNRAFLAAAGTSAMALQVAILRQGLDVLQAQGVDRVGVTGASGGAVQAFYLLLADPRVGAAVMASFPPIPREARAGGCACDQVPGWPGPRADVLALADRPTLWLSDVDQARPSGLPRGARFEVLAGPHGYEAPMQREALEFFEDQLSLRSLPFTDALPQVDIVSPGPRSGPGIRDLPLSTTRRWSLSPRPGVPFEVRCDGEGPAVLLAGGSPRDRQALRAARLRPCVVRLPEDEAGLAEAIATGGAYADRQAGGLVQAARQVDAVAVYGVRAWGLAAAGTGLPFVVRDPVRTLSDLDPVRDPPWVHVPGAWWGSIERALACALLTGPAPAPLAEALRAEIDN